MITSIALSRQNSVAWWQWFNVLSLDAPCVAVIWQLFFATSYRLHLPLSAYFLLGFAVWWLYVFDRCADVIKHPELAKLTYRHAFYLRHHKLFTRVLLPISSIGLLVSALFHLPQEILIKSFGLAFCVGIYFLAYVLKGRSWFSVLLCGVLGFITVTVLVVLPVPEGAKWILGLLICSLLIISCLGWMPTQVAIPKELIAAYLFSLGTLLHLGLYLRSNTLNVLTEPTVIFALLCLLNLLAISRADGAVDKSSHQQNQLTTSNRTWAFALAGLGVVLGCWALAVPYKPLHLPLLVGYGVALISLSWVYLQAQRLGAERTHFFADLSLIFAAILGHFCALAMQANASL